MKTIIEVKAFGDFCIKYTVCIMVSDEIFDIPQLQSEYCKQENIESFKGLPDNKLNEHTDKFIAFLSLKGFEMLQTKEIYFCD